MSTTRRRTAPPRLVRALVALATFATLAATPALTACSDDGAPSAPAAAIAGTYALERVNGQALPFALGNEHWDAMTLTLGSDRTLRGTLAWHETDDEGTTVDQGTDSFSGSYSAEGNRLTLRVEDDEPVTGVLDGELLTVTSDGNVMVFRRR